MGMFDMMTGGYVAKENSEFGQKKKLVGDAVCEVTLDKKVAKSGSEWIILKGVAINCIPDPKGRDTTLEPGDEIAKFYDPSNDESVQELMDDLFTAGISFSAGKDESSTLANAKAAADKKLVYFRTWAKDKTKEQIAAKPDKPTFFQNIKVLSSSKITEENSIPQIAF